MSAAIDFTQPLSLLFISGHHGAFYDTSTQSILVANQIKQVEINSTSISNGVTLGANHIVFNYAGTYDIQISLQITNTHNQAHLFYIWFAQNGLNVPESSSVVSVPSTHGSSNGHLIIALNMLVNANAGDNVELRWSANDNRVKIEKLSAPLVGMPDVPSVIITATQV